MSAESTPESTHPLALIVGAPGRTPERLRETLAHRGLTAQFASDGPAALDAARERTLSVVLIYPLDQRGQMDGIEVCRALRELADLRRCPIVVVAPAGDEATLERAFESGATDVCDADAPAAFVARRLAFAVRAGGERQAGARTTDSVDRDTGLPDGRSFRARVERAMNHSSVDGTSIAVLCVAVDCLEESFTGDAGFDRRQVLVDVASRLHIALRETDTLRTSFESPKASLARTAGGEFSIVLEGLERAEDAAKVAQRLMDLLSDPFELESGSVEVATNIGIAAYPCRVQGAEELITRSETAVLCAREEGRNTLRYYDSEMNSKAFERLTLETNLRLGLERDEFLVYYQPRVEISTGRLLSFEALVRWKHPELGLVAPAQFIPLAEETGLIVPLGEWVLATACRQNRAWQNAGLPPVSVSVNLSSVQFRKPDLYETVVRVLGESGLDPSWLELELTESLLMQNADAVVETLKRFRSAGIHLSIDDFGTGYSSLSYLKRFPIDALKIDRSFIREVTTNSDDAALATSIILMGRSLKLRVVAEGVETESQLSFLRIMQCDEVQGYLYSPPVPAAEATVMLQQGLVRPDAA